jgi:glucosamine--fructose-6-phosphate aminotransferase (isomerizing)
MLTSFSINYLVEKDRKFILDTLVNGEIFALRTSEICRSWNAGAETCCQLVLRSFTNSFSGLSRLEYRGYDSAGLAVDGDKKNEVFAFKDVGKVAKLKQLIEDEKPDLTKIFDSHAGIAHTRWATHGPPSRISRISKFFVFSLELADMISPRLPSTQI